MDTHQKGNSRRTFFQQLILGSAGLYLFPYLQSCDNGKYPDMIKGSGNPPFNVWEEMIYALENSPDHYLARRDNLVSAGDINAMRDFVVNDIGLLPSDKGYFRSIAAGLLYGPDAALRCGLATPREKAEILSKMLQEAGVEARVVLETVDMSEEEVKSILFNPGKAAFEPAAKDSDLKRWKKELGSNPENGTVVVMESPVEKATIFADGLLEKLDDKYKQVETESKFYFSNSGVPTVLYMEEGVEKYAHLFDPSVPLGSLHPSNKDNYTKDAKPLRSIEEEVSVTIKSTNAFDGTKEIELIKGSWKASDLVGNQVKVSFLNNMTFEDQAVKSVSDISTFTPCLALQAIHKDRKYMEERSFLGEPITLEGEKVFSEFGLQSKGDEQQGDIRDVVSLEIKAFPKTYPKVRLEIFPKDNEGKIVEGIKAGNFTIRDNNKLVTGLLRQNIVAPRIMLLYDTSLSMPNQYRDEGIVAFLEETQTAIRETYPHARIKLQETGSRIYTAHLKAAQTESDLILYATDGHNSDSFNPDDKPIFESGPPTLYLYTRDTDKYIQAIADNTGGMIIPAEDQQATILQIRETINSLEFPPYVFNYNSVEIDKDHLVEVSAKKNVLSASANFRFASKSSNAVGKRLTGIYMDIKIGNRSPIRRVLAGWDNYLDSYADPTPEMANAVHELLLGGVVIAFEREGASESIRLSEYLKTLMSNKAWFEAVQAGDNAMALEKLSQGTFDYPAILLNTMQPIKNNISKESITYPSGYRVGIIKFKPAYFSEASEVTFDYLPTSEYKSLTPSGRNAFIETTRKTAQLALLEEEIFDKTAMSELKNSKLVLNQDVSREEEYSSRVLAESYRYFREKVFRGGVLKLFDASAVIKSFWRIDPKTGELYGVLPDGTGGGGNSHYEQLQHLQAVVDEYEKVVARMNLGMGIAGVGGLAVGIVATYSLTLVRLYAFASEAIILMDASNLDDQIAQALQELACNVYKEILYATLGPVGEGMNGIENLIGSIGGDFSFVSC
ncbi:MAG: hypothetical protein KJO05_05730 [Bacteroidia bacterium]|nr:hypothetical protein [Bacteroidia bacterium]MBT8275298.1 hypothetical protein [Bacteroidia bacterium]NNF30579.1 hypothetical protein [Flavobacteriaceae bacterium]NNK53056.1 hypothetical protein [Flavobacteriaceae bacterium]NNM09843.1 hypothetical protein [Flavobacteriaceae bacterium]